MVPDRGIDGEVIEIVVVEALEGGGIDANGGDFVSVSDDMWA